ncbi:MAG: MFS transporter [Flavobacteriaceae bacterium]|nr:MFS transporter [Flavobacteriaceae bacterium]
MNRIFNIALTASLAGFLFGFDTVVISGANLPIKTLWNTSPLFHGFFIMSMALWGTVLGSIFGGIPCDRFGRKNTLIGIGILYTLSAIGSAMASNPILFSAFRFIGGVGVGISSVAAPIYISEIASAENRGKLGALYQFNIVFGILIAFLSNYLLKGFQGSEDWRWMLGVETLPAIIYTLLALKLPQSPRWLISKHEDINGARTILGKLYNQQAVDSAIAAIQEEKELSAKKKTKLFSSAHKKPLFLAFVIAFFNQLSGINFVLYYAPEILQKAGLASSESLFSSISIGLINLVFTYVGVRLIDRLGRRELLKIGSWGYIVSLGMVAYAFYASLSAGFLISFILLFIASHAMGQGAVIWVFISEIFPNKIRSYGQSWGASTHWIFAAIITLITPIFLDEESGIFGQNPWPIFAFFMLVMCIQLFWVITIMPETKGISLEELEKQM